MMQGARPEAMRREKAKGVQMENLLLWTGRIAGIAGLMLSAWAAYGRLTGAYFAAGFQIGTLLLAGMTGMLVACLCLLLVLTERSRR
jgi:hypothetical protein